jgi:transcriptional regulator with XRE-family HTH domain
MGFIGEISGDVGKRILQVRETEKLNQEEFANRLGLTKSAISGYETGRRVPTKAILKSIAQIFSYNENWLFRGDGDPKHFEIYEGLHAVFSHFRCSDFERDFLGKYFGMAEKDRHLFCYYMNYLFGADSHEISPENDLIHDALLELKKEHSTQDTDEETARQRAGDLYVKEHQKEEKLDAPASSANGSAVV